MPRQILPLSRVRIVPALRRALAAAVLCGWALAAQAGTATATIERVETPAATLRDVSIALSWERDAPAGELRLQASRVDAPGPGYHLRDVRWRCPLQRDGSRWECVGPVTAGGTPMTLSVALDGGDVQAVLGSAGARMTVTRQAATPDLTRVDLSRVPLAWAQSLLQSGWEDGRITAGTADGSLRVDAGAGAALTVAGDLALRQAGFDTPAGDIAGEGVDARLQLDVALGEAVRADVQGVISAGDLLFGTTYVALGGAPVEVRLQASADDDGWSLPRFRWHHPGVLDAKGRAQLSSSGTVRALAVQARSAGLDGLAAGYLSVWLGTAGLAGLEVQGAADARLEIDHGRLVAAELGLEDVAVHDSGGRFGFDGLQGDVRYSSGAAVRSALGWEAGALHGLAFGAAQLPFISRDGELALAAPARFPILGGTAGLDHLRIRPADGRGGSEVRFGLALDGLDVERLSAALGWPAFRGRLTGSIPDARYAGDRLDLGGGLQMDVFDGRISVTSLSMERPFGVAPTLEADITLDDIDLLALTGALEVGSIEGRLDGRIADLRLLDWMPVAFDARLQTQRHRGVRQRISQRAVQELSSVGDGSIAGGLQAQVIGLFDDFRYSRIGVSCRLAEEVCTMGGLGPAGDGDGYVIVRGAGLPRLMVVGFNRRVDWPTLVERLTAIGQGDVQAVVE